jgi:methionyl-tRNA formyltransferase
MRLIVLTTETPHHAYFVRELARRFPVTGVFLESLAVQAPYPTSHPFELERDAYEKEIWFGGDEPDIRNFAACQSFPDLNSPPAISAMMKSQADLGIVFGTGLLRSEAMKIYPLLLNLHGGDPELYRGLDTHLWAIWHRDFSSLITCLHHIAPKLDTGDIVGKSRINLKPGMKLHQLRAANTEKCLDLASQAASTCQSGSRITAISQQAEGRYYSFMPAALKTVCCEVFERYCIGLTGSDYP